VAVFESVSTGILAMPWQHWSVKMLRVCLPHDQSAQNGLAAGVSSNGKSVIFQRNVYVYFWADGIYCNVRMDDKQWPFGHMGATADGVKELVAIEGGFRESEMSWKQILLDLKSRGLTTAPQLAIVTRLGFLESVGAKSTMVPLAKMLGTQDC